jgi:segregation and condensation protein B
MSLKAKIEAVIYASEEPVTLAQLMGLLGEEAQLELDVREAEQPTLGLETDEETAVEVGDPDTRNAETLAESVAEVPAAPAGDEASPAETELQAATPENVEAAANEAASTKAANAKAVAAEAKVRERKLRTFFREVMDQLIADYTKGDRGLEVREVANGFRLATKPEYHDAVRGFVKQLKPPLKLSLQALETLAVVAYKQPVTAPEVSEIRGVDSGGVLGSLITRKLVQTAGRKQVIGRPMLYKTSKDFLVRFGLKDINELPSIEEFEKMAGELNEAVQEEIQMDQDGRDRESEESAEGAPALDEINSTLDTQQPVHENADEVVDEKETAEEEKPDADAEGDSAAEETSTDEASS